MYKCLECGNLFEEGEEATWSENRGEFWGSPCSESVSGCPICKGEYEKTTKCKLCNSENLKDELTSGICDDCLEEYSTNIDVVFKMAKGSEDTISINSFLYSVYDKETIEEILLENLKQTAKYRQEKIKKFFNDDKTWFAERLQEVLNDEK